MPLSWILYCPQLCITITTLGLLLLLPTDYPDEELKYCVKYGPYQSEICCFQFQFDYRKCYYNNYSLCLCSKIARYIEKKNTTT